MIQSLASGMQVQWRRHELLANNLANAATTGFKQDDLTVLAGPQSWPAGAVAPSVGVQGIAPWTDYSAGTIRTTGRELDVALDGPGFLAVQTARGERYTRAGALGISRDGYLVTAAGDQVLGAAGPIAIRGTRPAISAKGEVQDGGRVVDTLRVVDFDKPYRLVKEGNGLFAAANPAAPVRPAADTQVVAGALEDSNVNTVRTMVDMIEMLRSYESAQRAIQAADEADHYAANDMGRV
jgi:flagellar basal-body rod protein FlgG